MTKKDFKMIADCLRDTRPRVEDINSEDLFNTVYTQWYYTVRAFHSTLMALNPRFNGKKFEELCHKR